MSSLSLSTAGAAVTVAALVLAIAVLSVVGGGA
jgi:hypothetical protein